MEKAVERIVEGYFRGEDLSELIKNAGEKTKQELKEMSKNYKRKGVEKPK